VHARLADCVVDGGHAVLDRAGEDAGEVLWDVSGVACGESWERGLTGERFSRASPTVRLRSSYEPPLISAITSTDSKTLRTVPAAVSSDIAPTDGLRHTLLVYDGYATDVLLDQHVDDVHDRCVHITCRNILVSTNVHLPQGFAQLLCLLDVDGDELQNAVLCDD